MKKFLALLFVLFVLSACCTPTPSRAPAKRPDVTTVTVSRDFAITLHADKDFNAFARERIDRAARDWRDVTRGRARIDVLFDVDFDSVANLETHRELGHAWLIGTMSDWPMGMWIDRRLGGPGATPLAATIEPVNGPVSVFLIVDRIAVEDFFSVVLHELGHVMGLPDLETFNSVMSGGRRREDAPADKFTAEDMALCRSYRFCD